MRKIQCEACPVRVRGGVCDLPPEALEDFKTTGITSVYKPRQVVFSEGNPCEGLYLVCHGAVKLFHSDRFGRDHILEIATPGAVLGELPMDEGQQLSISAEATAESQLCFLPRDRLHKFLQRHPLTAVRLLGALSAELASARQKARDLALKGAESRLAGLLLRLVSAEGPPNDGDRLALPYTRRELAEMIGVSTETAIRLLARLKKKRAIDTQRRDLVVTDLEKLQRIANTDNVELR